MEYIKLTQDLVTEDAPNLFPIVIPKGKTVHLDVVENSIFYSYTNTGNYVSSVFLIDEGSFFIRSTGRDKRWGRIVLMNGNDDGDILASKGNVIENRNGGLLHLEENSYLSLLGTYGTKSCYIVYNTDSTVICENINIDDLLDAPGDNAGSFYNGKNSNMTIKGGLFRYGDSPCIINYGVIDVIEDVYFTYSTNVIENYGTIGRISYCTFDTYAYNRKGIVCSGSNAIVYEISDSSFLFNRDVFSDNPNDEPSTAIEFTSGATLGEIKNCETNAAIPIICDDTVKIIVGISSGKFSKPIDEKYLATGRTCVYNEEEQMYIVQ